MEISNELLSKLTESFFNGDRRAQCTYIVAIDQLLQQDAKQSALKQIADHENNIRQEAIAKYEAEKSKTPAEKLNEVK